jgi:hypothetical protein
MLPNLVCLDAVQIPNDPRLSSSVGVLHGSPPPVIAVFLFRSMRRLLQLSHH